MRKHTEPIKNRKENTIYALLFFFAYSFLIKVVFGCISGSKSLLVSGLFALFGILASAVTLLRIQEPLTVSKHKINKFSYRKLEFIVIAGISLIIIVSTGAILFSAGHLVFFHALYSPGLIGAWTAMFLAAINWAFVHYFKDKICEVEEANIERMKFFLHKDFILSILVMLTVVVSRIGFIAIDYIFAILEAGFIIIYSMRFFYNSLKGLMDASCDKLTLTKIAACIKKADAALSIHSLKVCLVRRTLEINVIIELSMNSEIEAAKRSVKKIKHVLKANFVGPHEVHVGFKGKEV